MPSKEEYNKEKIKAFDFALYWIRATCAERHATGFKSVEEILCRTANKLEARTVAWERANPDTFDWE